MDEINSLPIEFWKLLHFVIWELELRRPGLSLVRPKSKREENAQSWIRVECYMLSVLMFAQQTIDRPSQTTLTCRCETHRIEMNRLSTFYRTLGLVGLSQVFLFHYCKLYRNWTREEVRKGKKNKEGGGCVSLYVLFNLCSWIYMHALSRIVYMYCM